MRILLLILFSLTYRLSYANVDNYTLKLDEFTLATSQSGLHDTIVVTKAAWTTSDSLHLYIYKCGGSFMGEDCRIMARDTDNKLFEMYFTNQGMAIQFSIATKRIDPSVVKFVALSMGLAPTEKRMGINYRMGFLRFI